MAISAGVKGGESAKSNGERQYQRGRINERNGECGSRRRQYQPVSVAVKIENESSGEKGIIIGEKPMAA